MLTYVRLHKEICDFYDFARPYEYEEAVRRDLIARVEKGLRTFRGNNAASVKVLSFGSFAAGLYLPTADMDLVAVSPQYMSGGRALFCQSNSAKFKLKYHLENASVAPTDGVVVIAKAKVPIVKFPDKMTGIKVDISFENDSGIIANKTFEQWKQQYPAMPVVVVLVKQLLAMRGLNEVYTGGIGGFTTICLVVSMMQLMPELQSEGVDAREHYGELLMNFLDLYGNKFDTHRTGIRMSPPGYFDKVRDPAPTQNLNRLTIIDPNRPTNDVSGGSHEIDAVLDCFKAAHGALQRRLSQVQSGKDVEDSILGCMWGGNYSSFTRQREKLSQLHRGYAVSPPPAPPAPKGEWTMHGPQKPQQQQKTAGPAAKKNKKQEAQEFQAQAQPAPRFAPTVEFHSQEDRVSGRTRAGSHANGQTIDEPRTNTRSQVAQRALPPRPPQQVHALPPRPDTQAQPPSSNQNGYANLRGDVFNHYHRY